MAMKGKDWYEGVGGVVSSGIQGQSPGPGGSIPWIHYALTQPPMSTLQRRTPSIIPRQI